MGQISRFEKSILKRTVSDVVPGHMVDADQAARMCLTAAPTCSSRAGRLDLILVRDPSALRMAVSLCLNTTLPTAISWGPDLRLLYNDA
jgi:hypothetical protein